MKAHYTFGQHIINEQEDSIDKIASLWVTRDTVCDDCFYAYNHGVPVKVKFNDDQKDVVKSVTDNLFRLTAITVKISGFEADRIPVAELIEVGDTVIDCPI